MNRTGLLIALGAAVATGVVFALFPELDLAIARLFYAPGSRFVLKAHTVLVWVREISMWIVACLVAPAVIAIVLKIARPQSRMMVSGRASVFLVVTLLLGPVLAVNGVLKDQWSRPRPREVVEFGGTHKFLPWWDPRGSCADNCSFVAGEASGAAWTLAPAALAPPQWRALAYTAALGFTAVIGGLRIAFGGHFFSDVIFAIALTFIIVWLVHGWLFRWRSRPTDAAIEDGLGRFGRWLRGPFGRGSPVPPQKAAGPSSESYSSVQKGPP